jgi:sugar fermentation stimulation protein A
MAALASPGFFLSRRGFSLLASLPVGWENGCNRLIGNGAISPRLEKNALSVSAVAVKNVHLMRRPGVAEFPDAVTARGAKHLDELAGMAAAGNRAVMLYLVQIPSATSFALARDIDPSYATAFDRARGAGVEAVAYRCAVARDAIALSGWVPIVN